MIGKTVSRYRIVEEIGRGGMGVVYKAEDTRLKRTVALKFLPPSVGKDERARFQEEAQSAAHLQHPNICTVYEIDEVDGQQFIAMAYIDGVELKALTAAGPMALDEAVSVAVQVASALEEAHEHDIVHRDIKSANVMINRKGLAKVMDFGLAKRVGRTQITQIGTSLGTIDYMSPEQTRGDTLDHRTDVWSYGVMLYEMIAGKMPFRGEFDQAVIYSILNETPVPLTTVRPETPQLLSDIVARALAKQPEDRYATMGELLADLHVVQSEVGMPSGSSVTGAINWTGVGRPSTGGTSGARSRTTPTTAPGVDARGLKIIAGYVAGAALVVVLLRWLVSHFPVSPNVPGFGLWVLLALLPTVAVLALFRGRNRVRVIGVPATLLAAAALLFSMFGDKDLGAATRTVRVTDENGDTVERVVPKQEFRKRMALFYFDNQSGDSTYDWLGYAFAHMIRYEVTQDPYVSVGVGFTRPHKEAGFDVPLGSPVVFKRKLAQEFHYPFMVVGNFDVRDGNYIVDLSLQRSQDGSPVAQRHYENEDVFALVDALALQLRHDLGIPDYHIEQVKDLHVSEIFTNSIDAAEDFVRGINVRWQQNDFQASVDYLTRAVERDPAFAAANYNLAQAQVNVNNGAAAETAIRNAIQHKYKLPERMQFEVMHTYHDMRQDADAMMLNARRWVSLYPDDADAHLKLAELHERAGDTKAAIVERKAVFELSPDRYGELHTIANLYEDVGEMEEAERYLKQYKELFPDKYDSYTWLGSFYLRRGDFDEARKNYKQALILEPDRMFIRTRLAEIERQDGNFDESLRLSMQALETAQSAQDSVNALEQLMTYHMFRGQANTAVGYLEQRLDVESRYRPPLQVLINKLFTLGLYVDAGRADEALAIAREMEERPAVPWFKSFVAAGYIITYGFIDDPANADIADKYLNDFERWVSQSGMNQLDWVVDFTRSFTLDWRGRHDEALASVKDGLESVPQDEKENLVWMKRVAGKYSRELGNYAEAESFLDSALEIEPWSPDVHFELARVFFEQGKFEEARRHIDKALEVWEDADPQHPRASKARELAKSIRTSS